MTVTWRSSMPSAEKDKGIPQFGAANHWHALHTRYQHEKAVAHALSNKGHNVFLPLYGATHLWRGRPTQLQLPLFPGYAFIHGGIDRQLQILSTPGIIDIVKSGGLPAIVPPEQIDSVRRIVENSSRIEPHSFLQSGDRVIVISGPLQGVEGFLVRTKGTFRLVMSMEMLGRSAAVEIDVSCVQRVCQPLLVARSRRLAASA
jgi:transcription antitermination factor NusG